MPETRVVLRQSWYVDDEDGVDATLFVEDNGEEEIVHVDTPDGMLSLEMSELLRAIALSQVGELL